MEDNSINKMKVLVTGAGGASGICTILSLKEATDNIIIGCDCNEYSSGLYLADEKFVIPPAKDKDKFLKGIISKIKEYKIDVVFSNVDEELLVFSKYKSEIPCSVIISPFSTIDICNDKSKLENIVPLPSTENISPPFLIKPKIGRGSRNIYKVESNEEMEALFKYLDFKGLNKKDFIIQEFLPGKEYTIDALFDGKG
ncbi:MAG TPA: ATP-grasp domain-containing protein, partial [bacterium]|nr:ATP-grasp domain-containing protein [bacterium]